MSASAPSVGSSTSGAPHTESQGDRGVYGGVGGGVNGDVSGGVIGGVRGGCGGRMRIERSELAAEVARKWLGAYVVVKT